MPVGLNETYERIWTRITGRTAHRTQRMWALKTLKLIIFAKRPLSTQEILEATSLNHEDTTFVVGRMASSIEYLIGVCGNFISLDSHTSRVRFVHYSVPEFLGSKAEFLSSESMITEACFITLGQQGGSSGEGGQFYTYAARYWAEHSLYLETINNRLANLILRFLLNREFFEDWRAQRQGILYSPDTPYQALTYFNLPVILQCLQTHGSHQDGFALAQSESLVLSADWGYPTIVQLFLDAGAEVDFSSSNGVSSLQAAVKRGWETIVKQLLAAGANANCRDSKGESCLHAGVIRGSENIVALLLAASAEPNFPNPLGRSNLQSAAIRGFRVIVQLLLSAGAQVNFRDKNGRSALDDAVSRDSEGIVELLLCSGADVNFLRGGLVFKYRSALQKAVSNGSERIVALLLAAGADPNVRDPKHGLVLDEAISYSSDAIIQQLRQAGARSDQTSRLPHQPGSLLDPTECFLLQEALVAQESAVQHWINSEIVDNAQVLDNISALEHVEALETVHISENTQLSENCCVLMNIHVVDDVPAWTNT